MPVDYQPSAFAPLRVVRAIKTQLPKAIDAVETHLGATVPPLTVAIAGRPGLATAQILAARTRGVRFRHAAAYWRIAWCEARGSLAYTSVTRTDQILIALNAPELNSAPHEIWPTLVHELVHAVQYTRPGRRVELQTALDNNLRIADAPSHLRHAMDAVTAIEEAEAYQVQYELDPEAELAKPFDRQATFHRLVSAVSHWEAATSPQTART